MNVIENATVDIFAHFSNETLVFGGKQTRTVPGAKPVHDETT